MGSDFFAIEGGRRLAGEVEVSGSKNAALAVIPATLLTREPCVLENVPVIEDVRRLLEMLQSVGAEVSWQGEHTVRIHAKHVDASKLDQTLVERLRASVSLLGPLLARTGRAYIVQPGGDTIGARPIDTHLDALRRLGARVRITPGHVEVATRGLYGRELALAELSVTATQNAVSAAACAEGTSVIHIAAAEPQVGELIRFLTAMGARITGAGSHTLAITGVKKLRGARHRLIGDYIEAGTFAVALAATRGKGSIRGVDPHHLLLPVKKLQQAGVTVRAGRNMLAVESSRKLVAIAWPGIQALPYPGFPTDLQAPFCVLATQLEGTTRIQEPLFEGRLKHVEELRHMGADVAIADPHRAFITGPTPLHGARIPSLDVRAGATLVIAALVAKGASAIQEVYTIDRGYERLEEKLQGLGADITRISA